MDFTPYVTVLLSILTASIDLVKGDDVCYPYGHSSAIRTYCYGDSYCCNGGLYCCETYVYQLWWFWFIWVIFFVCLTCCIICLRRRRQRLRYQQIRVAQPVYGTTATVVTSTSIPPPNYQQMSNPTAPPQYSQYPEQKPPPYGQ